MKTYILSIDETGKFAVDGKAKDSFVTGVCSTKDFNQVKQAFAQARSLIFPGENLNLGGVNKCDISKKLTQNDCFHFKRVFEKKNDHFNLSEEDQLLNLKAFKDNLFPLIDKTFISTDKPLLYANNQDWWLKAVIAVIDQFLDDLMPTFNVAEDRIQIYIDPRRMETTGNILPERVALENEIQKIINPSNQKGLTDEQQKNNIAKQKEAFVEKSWEYFSYENDFYAYHDNIINKIEPHIRQRIHGLQDFVLKFDSDTHNLYVSLADIACGFIKQGKTSRLPSEEYKLPYQSRSCALQSSGDNPFDLQRKNPLGAVSCIFESITSKNAEDFNKYQNLLKTILKEQEKESVYLEIWNLLLSFIQNIIDTRDVAPLVIQIRPLLEVFVTEFKEFAKDTLPITTCIQVIQLYIKYQSHAGDTTPLFCKEDLMSQLQRTERGSEGRALRRWEEMIRYQLRWAEIQFNGYQFESIQENFEKLFDQQEQIIQLIDPAAKDNHMVSILGTLAQSQAYLGNLKAAADNFELSKMYAVNNTAQTDAYIEAIYQRQEQYDDALTAFNAQLSKGEETEASATNYINYLDKNSEKPDVWTLLSYVRLRALGLYLKQETTLKTTRRLLKECREYPYPLIYKWEAMATYLEGDAAQASLLLQTAIEELDKAENGFAIKALSLPLKQMLAIISPNSIENKKYKRDVERLKEECPGFKAFVETRSPLLESLDNSATLWERAMSLPFIYA